MPAAHGRLPLVAIAVFFTGCAARTPAVAPSPTYIIEFPEKIGFRTKTVIQEIFRAGEVGEAGIDDDDADI